MQRPAQRRLVFLTTAFALSLLSCGREVTGPENGLRQSRVALLALAPEMPGLMQVVEGAGDVVPFTRVRVLLRNEDGSVAKDTVIVFPEAADSVSLALLLPIPSSAPEQGLPLLLSMAYVNAAGDTVFRAGPSAIVARPVGSSGAGDPVVIPVTYDGPGKDAAAVIIAPDTGTRSAGSSQSFTAMALDAQSQVIANTPIVYFTLDSTRVQVNGSTGVATFLPLRGSARIVAALPSGLRADTANFTVTLPASQLVLGSGQAQSGVVSAPLADSIVVRTLASDGLPAPGVVVSFAVASGGGTLSALVDTSDASGNVSTRWTLGAALGAQGISASAEGLSGSPLAITATAVAGTAVAANVVTAPTGGIAGAALPAFSYGVYDQHGNLATSYSGVARLTLQQADSSQPAAVIVSGDSAVVENGVVTFNALIVSTAGTFGIVADFGASLGTVASNPITVTAAAPALLASVSGDGQSAPVLQRLANPLRARVTDAFGNAARGVNVNFNVVSGLATLDTNIVTTDSTGHAQVGVVMGTQAGPLVIGAFAAGLTPNSVLYTLTALAGAPSVFVVLSGNNQQVIAGGSSDSVRLRLNDAHGNPVPGATVTWNPTSDLTLTPTSGVTDAAGTTATVVTSGGLLGVKSFSASSAPAADAVLSIETLVGPADSLIVVSGANQEGFATLLLDFPVVVKVVDAFNNARAGDSVFVSVTSGNGSVGGGLSTQALVTDAQGTVSVVWTLGDLLGTQTISVRSATRGPITVSATAVQTVANRIWTGDASSSVSDAGNWRNGLLPAAADSVLVPAGRPNYPVLVDSVEYRRFTLDSGATFNLGNANLIVNGAIRTPLGSGLLATGTGKVIIGRNVSSVLAGTFPKLQIEGSYLPVGVVDVVDSLIVTNNASLFVQNGDSLHVGNVLVTTAGGLVQQTGNSAISAGNLSLSGGSSSFGAGGRLHLVGSLSTGVNGVPTAFVADSTHTLILLPNATQTITLAYADSTPGGPCDASCLGTVVATKGFGELGVSFGSTVMARGGFQLSVENLAVAGQYLVNGAPSSISFSTGGNFRRFGFTGSFTMTNLYTADTLVAFGSGALPAGLSVPTIVEGSYSIAATHDAGLVVHGVLDVVGASATVSGMFLTQGLGQLRMTDATDVLTVFGEALFNGGASLLSAGTLRLHRRIDVGSPQGFQGQPTHTTEFVGGISQQVGFSYPGFGAQQSYLGRVLLSKTGGAPFSSTVVNVNGQLVTSNLTQSWAGAGSKTPLVVRGTNISALALSNQPFVIEDGAAISSLAGLTFSGFTEAGVTQLTITRSGGAVNLASPTFHLTAPLPLSFLRAADNTLNSDPLTVSVSNPNPLYHEGRISTAGEAVIQDWAAFPAIVWAGSLGNNWFEPGNWVQKVVPTSSDSVLILIEGAVPVLSAATTIRALNWQNATPLQLAADLTIRGSYFGGSNLRLPQPGVTCGVGGRLTFAPPNSTVDVAGAVSCPVYVNSGVVRAPTGISVDSLIIQGDGEFTVEDAIINVSGNLRTADKGTLRMGGSTPTAGTLSVSGNATFTSTPRSNSLLGGTLLVYGNFTQATSPNAFRAGRDHRTSLGGFGVQSVSFAHPDSIAGSYFGSLSIEQIETGSYVALGSDVFVEGSLIASNGSVRDVRSGGELLRRIRSRGAFTGTLGSLALSNVAWEIRDGVAIAATDTLRNVQFTGMIGDGSTQLRIARSGGTLNLKSFSFDLLALNPIYLEAQGLAVDSLYVIMTLPSPSTPGSGLKVIGSASVSWISLLTEPIVLNLASVSTEGSARSVASGVGRGFRQDSALPRLFRPFPPARAWAPPSS